MTSVFVVKGYYQYEGSEPIRAFAEREQAEAFAATCNAYSQTCPKCPELDDDDAAWDAYYAAEAVYRGRHPAGEEASADGFMVSEIPFGPTPRSGETP